MSQAQYPAIGFAGLVRAFAYKDDEYATDENLPVWRDVHLVVAQLAPDLFGISASFIVGRRGDVGLCDSPPPALMQVIIDEKVSFSSRENELIVSMYYEPIEHGHAARQDFWFLTHDDFWSFLGQVAEGKDVHSRRDTDIKDRFKRVLDTFPTIRIGEEDSEGLVAVNRNNATPLGAAF